LFGFLQGASLRLKCLLHISLITYALFYLIWII